MTTTAAATGTAAVTFTADSAYMKVMKRQRIRPLFRLMWVVRVFVVLSPCPPSSESVESCRQKNPYFLTVLRSLRLCAVTVSSLAAPASGTEGEKYTTSTIPRNWARFKNPVDIKIGILSNTGRKMPRNAITS
eukprot:GHVT01023678.1.p2 GENE.GHVT01023678.1~~GHVT01023678.1.p2  ORF type:complete len:133 (+),score=9.94 GHVT01023678.1:311-709(+)